ncbi:Transaldolase [Hypsizygus marmoreus]|uniref:Transaldolase n=1 Tax=Hypsizygus marmoreus TaxID=39966 RepID=A0A369JFN8_HYPMA|nr:Transaldolase [Hypsizygus marmoreus]
MSLNALQTLRQAGITIASDTGEYLKIGEFYPQDATTNPSLVFAAVTKPEYSHIIDGAVQYALSRRTTLEAQTELACDYLLVQVGLQILNIIPGRVSVSVDPRLAHDYDAIVAKSHNLISIFEELGVPRHRILVKIPATYSGILASQSLETLSTPIHTNATLIFSLVQALACAQAGIAVISPFIGRVKDWWAVHDTARNGGIPPPERALSEHPGILLVHEIRRAFTEYGYDTQVMAAGFRTIDEIVELGKNGSHGGPDLVTLPPELLEGLRRRPGGAIGVRRREGDKSLGDRDFEAPRYISRDGLSTSTPEHEAAYTADLTQEKIALDKVPEGLAKFSVDAKKLEDLLRGRIRISIESETSARL